MISDGPTVPGVGFALQRRRFQITILPIAWEGELKPKFAHRRFINDNRRVPCRFPFDKAAIITMIVIEKASRQRPQAIELKRAIVDGATHHRSCSPALNLRGNDHSAVKECCLIGASGPSDTRQGGKAVSKRSAGRVASVVDKKDAGTVNSKLVVE